MGVLRVTDWKEELGTFLGAGTITYTFDGCYTGVHILTISVHIHILTINKCTQIYQ